MFRVRSLNRGRMFGVLHVASEERALCAMVGSMGLETWRGDVLSRLLLDAVGALGGELDDDTPARLGEALLARLAIPGEPPERPSWVLYAAALLRPGAVAVCHAGDLRVQLAQDGAAPRTTTDHTIGNLLTPEEAAQAGAQRNVTVRSLAHDAALPDRALWPLEAGRARLVIASYEVHGHAPNDQTISWPKEPFDWGSGAIIEIERD